MSGLLTQIFGSPAVADAIAAEEADYGYMKPKAEGEIERYNVPTAQLPLVRLEKSLISSYISGTLINEDHVVRQAENGIDIYQEMLDKDAHVFASSESLIDDASGTPYVILPASDSPQAMEHAAFVTECFTRFDFLQAMKNIYHGALKGISVNEIVWDKGFKWNGKKKNGFEYFDRLRESEIVIDRFGEPRWLTARHMTDFNGAPLPKDKFIFARFGSGPYGDALLKHCYAAYWYKRNAQLFYAKFLERWGDPALIGFHGGSTDMQKVVDILEQIRSSAYGSLPESLKEPMILEPGREVSFNNALTFWNDEISKVILSGTRTMAESGAAGSFAATKSHHQSQQSRVQSLSKMGRAIINFRLIRLLIDRNYGIQPAYPYLEYGEQDEDTPATYLSNLKLAADSNIKVQVSLSEFYERAGFTKPVDATDAIELGTGAPTVPGMVNFQEGEQILPSLTSPKTKSAGIGKQLKPSTMRLRQRLNAVRHSMRETPKS